MGVRPPQQEDDDGPETVAFGIAQLAEHLDEADLDYPVTGDEVVSQLGDPRIDVDATGRSTPLSDAMERVDHGEFDSERELLDALHPVFESYRESSGVLSSIRSLLPV